MARLKKDLSIKIEASDDSDYVVGRTQQKHHREGQRSLAATSLNVKHRTSPRKQPAKRYCDSVTSAVGEPDCALKPTQKSVLGDSPRSKQVRLAPLNAVTLRKPLPTGPAPRLETESTRRVRNTTAKPSKRRHNAEISREPTPLHLSKDELSVDPLDDLCQIERDGASSDEVVELEVEESVWCGSDEDSSSEEELPSPRKLLSLPALTRNKETHSRTLPSSFETAILDSPESVTARRREASTKFGKPAINMPKSSCAESRSTSSSDKENFTAFLRFSPPRLHSPRRAPSSERPVTPPQSPSRSRLQSPSKTKTRVPNPPMRPSLDAFWDVDAVNDWHDQYSPQKVLKSPRKLKSIRDDASTSPSSSPHKGQSPSKRTKAEVGVKKSFEAGKHRLASDFLAELDRVVTQGKIGGLASATGGVKFVWSKTLNSTAGRANWRRETTKTRQLDGTTLTTHKHHASIELAEKVIDDENRLLNIIAHEFSHLANFMVSGIKDQPHGRQFKEWGRKCTQAFGDRGVEVTTKHSYQIEYKYIWQCSNEDCAAEFKRHSKSIDPKRQTCGSCRSKLVQIKPLPRKDTGNGTGYAAFVKTHFADIKRAMPGASQKEVMEAVGRKYRAGKAAREPPSDAAVVDPEPKKAAEVDKIARVLEFITLDDD